MFKYEESGQGMVEYSLILVLISLVLVVALGDLGSNSVGIMYDRIKTEILNLKIPQ